jgi:hypothetical protein
MLVREGTAGADSALMSIAQTDAQGRYRLLEVPAGRYYITAGPLDGLTYFPGASAPGKATVITVEPRAELTGMDFSLVTPPLVRVSGVVVNENSSATTLPANAPPALRTVVPTQVRLSGVGPIQTAAVGADGAFEFRNVRPGTYQANILPAALRTPPITITVGDSDITGLRLAIPLILSVSGSVVVENNGPLPRFQLSFSSTNPSVAAQAAPGPGGGGFGAPFIATQGVTNVVAGAAFNVLMPVGEYRINPLGLPVGFAVKVMTAGPADLLKEPLKVTAFESPNIQITLSVSPEAFTKVSGRIVGRGAPGMTPNILMTGGLVSPQEPATVYLDGSFEFPKVLPGTYQLRVTTPSVTDLTAANLALAMLGIPSFTEPVTLNVPSTGITGAQVEAALWPGPASIPTGGTTGARITGRIVGRAHWPGPASVVLTGNGGADLSTPIYWDGSFEFPAVPAGTWEASVRPTIPGAAPTVITVDRGLESKIEVRVPATRRVVGRVVIDGPQAPLRNLTFVVATVRVATPIQHDGRFGLIVPEGGAVTVAPESLPAGYAVESIAYAAGSTTELFVRLQGARVSTSTVSGRVTGVLPSGSHVWLSSLATTGALATLESDVQQDGSFRFANVVPGRYALRFSALGMPAITAPAPVEVAGADISGLQLTAPRMGTGRVVLQGNGAIPRFSLPLRSDSSETAVTINPESDGSFRVALPVGIWQIGTLVGLPNGVTIVSINYGSTDVSKGALRVTESDSVDLIITLMR